MKTTAPFPPSCRRILITGGTGSFGKRFVQAALQASPAIERLAIYSRDEFKQFEMQQFFPADLHPNPRFFIGDVRDPQWREAGRRALDRQVGGADQSLRRHEALLRQAFCRRQQLSGKSHHPLRRRPVRQRHGESRQCDPILPRKTKDGSAADHRSPHVAVQHHARRGVDLVLHALKRMWGGEIYVPRITSYRITDVADAIGPECDKPVAGIRPGEKLHEEMITETDGLNSLAFADHFVIKPTMPLWSTEEYCEAHGCEPCVSGFRYSSGANEQWMSVDDIRDLVVRHVDLRFAVRVRRAA